MRRALLTIFSLGLLASCSPDVTNTAPTAPGTNPSVSTPVSIVMDTVALEAGDSVLPTVRVTVDGTVRTATAAELIATSSDTSVLVILPNGALMAVGDGTVTVTVAWAASPTLAYSRTLTVVSQRLAAVTVAAPAQLVIGDSSVVHVNGIIRGGRIVVDPSSVTVTSSNPAVLRVTGRALSALTTGTSWLVARANTGAADSTQVTVVAGAPSRVTVGTHVAALVVGDQLAPTFTVADRLGDLLAGAIVTWSSSAATVASVSSAGVITALEAGSARIVATAGSGADTILVTVTAPALQQLIISPSSITLNANGSLQLSVTAIDTRGNSMTLPAVTWTSQMTGVTVSSSGLVQALAGVTTSIAPGIVQVRSGSVIGQVSVSTIAAVVTPPVSPSDYVQIRWIGDMPSASIVAAFEAARTKINGLFLSFNGVAPTVVNTTSGTCIPGSPAMNETVKGIVIFAQVTTIDGVGNILGSAGPCYERDVSLLPVLASMQFDVADMNSMVANGSLNGVVLHEMMHTLGFGTIWGPGALGQVASPQGSDPRYIGVSAQAAFAAMGGVSATGIAVENTGGSGTKGSHWRETTFRTELMTGWADGSMAMSRMTVGALRDFGYDVDLSKADTYVLPSSLVAGQSLLATGTVINETTTTPIGIVTPSGHVTPITGTVAH